MTARVPATFRKYVVKKITSKFREAVELITTTTPELGPKDLLIKNRQAIKFYSTVSYVALFSNIIVYKFIGNSPDQPSKSDLIFIVSISTSAQLRIFEVS